MKRQKQTIWMLSLGLVLLFSVACGSSDRETTAESEIEVNEPTAVAEEPEKTLDETMADNTEVDSTESESVGEPNPNQLNDEQVAQMFQYLVSPNSDEVNAAITTILDAQDERFVSVFIELIRTSQLGITQASFSSYTDALEELSGEPLGGDWFAWIEWYGKTDLSTPPGFTTWKGEMLGQIDPGFAEFLNSDYPSTIRSEEIQWGGVRVDGIPALDHSPQIAAVDAGYLNPEDAVFGMEINGDARAYPLRIMDWHEMANDTIGDVPVSIAYCTLCGAAVAYDGRASNGESYDFGSSGFLFRSNKLMYDRQTRTLWNQLTGEPVLGELVGQDVTLDVLPIVLTTWEEWQALHPNTTVLSSNTGFDRPYDPGAAYADYFALEETMFPVWQRSELYDAKDQVYALRIDGVPKAYPIELLTAEQIVNDTLAETNVVLISATEEVIIEGFSRRMGINRVYSAGAGVRAYDRGNIAFRPGETADTVIDTSGTVWQVTENALISEDGEELARLGGHLAYWFGWFAFFPNTLVYGQ